METNQNLNPDEATMPAVVTAQAVTDAPETVISETSAEEEPYDYEAELRHAIRKRAEKDMLYGALWCIGGTVLTMANVGFIFWGAILFGGIQFFRGLSNYMSQ